MTDYRPDYRVEALDRAVRVALALGGEPDAQTVKRAQAFEEFLRGNPS